MTKKLALFVFIFSDLPPPWIWPNLQSMKHYSGSLFHVSSLCKYRKFRFWNPHNTLLWTIFTTTTCKLYWGPSINSFYWVLFFFLAANTGPVQKLSIPSCKKRKSNEFQKSSPDLFHNLLMIALIKTYIAMPLWRRIAPSFLLIFNTTQIQTLVFLTIVFEYWNFSVQNRRSYRKNDDKNKQKTTQKPTSFPLF